MKQFVFTSGLPRAGSTLIQNILAQNPRFHATSTSGCLDVLFGIRNNWSNLVEHRASPCPEKLTTVLRSVLESYHSDTDRPIVIEKSRGWIAYIEMIEKLLGTKAKIIVPVRPVPEILASFEKLYRETAKVKQPPGEAENYFQFQTVKGRCEHWMRNDQVVGLALNRVQDAMARGFSDRLCLVPFEDLTSKPEETMKGVYKFIGEPYYDHDFNNVEQVTKEDDEIYGFVNLHKIQPKVTPVKKCAVEILGKEVMKKFQS